MDLTQDSYEDKTKRAKKMMLWFGIISMGMMFAGLTSAYVVSKSRPDWMNTFELPLALYWSTAAILVSSITFHFAKISVKKNDRKTAGILLVSTLALGILFIFLQFVSFDQIISNGYYFTGSESTVTTSFLYVIVLSHLVHIAVGLVVLLVVIYNHFKQYYTPQQMLGIELGATFWHFVDFLWLYLFLFLYFVR